MALSRIAAQHAAEIANHDWSDAPYRADRAGHRRSDDRRPVRQLETPKEVEILMMNVAWVTAQVLAFNDPNFDEHEFFAACGLNPFNRDGSLSGGVTAGLRFQILPDGSRHFDLPGTFGG